MDGDGCVSHYCSVGQTHESGIGLSTRRATTQRTQSREAMRATLLRTLTPFLSWKPLPISRDELRWCVPKSQHERQSEQTRRRLMDATRDLVVKNGWSSTSSRAIADRAGVNQALINFHFNGKAGLFRATLERCVDEIEADFGPWMAASSLAGYIDKCIESIPRVRRNKNFKFLFVAMLEGAHDAEIKKAVIHQVRAFRDGLGVFLENQGLSEEDVARYAAIMAAAMDGLMIHFMLDPLTDAKGALRAFEEMVALVVQAQR